MQGETDLGEVGMMVEIRSEHVEISLEEEEQRWEKRRGRGKKEKSGKDLVLELFLLQF